MGYWTTDKSGNSFAVNEDGPEMLWGDAPADIVDDALDQIVNAFREDVGRKPTKAELHAGLEFSLGIYEEND